MIGLHERSDEAGARLPRHGHALVSGEYGRRFIRFGHLEEHERMWCLLTHLHGLMLQGKNELALARVCQSMKAVETSVASGGRWDLAWIYTGVKDPRPRFLEKGLAHPREFAASASYLKEMRSVHDALLSDADGRRGGGRGGSGGGTGSVGSGGGYGGGGGGAANGTGSASSGVASGADGSRVGRGRRSAGGGGRGAGGGKGSTGGGATSPPARGP